MSTDHVTVLRCKSFTFVEYILLLSFLFHSLTNGLGDWRHACSTRIQNQEEEVALILSYYAKSLLPWILLFHLIDSHSLFHFQLKISNALKLSFIFNSLPLFPTSVPKAIMSCFNIHLLEYGWAMNSDTILFISVYHQKLLPGMRLRKHEAGHGFLGLESWFVYRFLFHHDKTWVSEQFFGGPCSSPDPCFLAFFSLFFLFSNSWTLFKHSGAEMFHPCDF